MELSFKNSPWLGSLNFSTQHRFWRIAGKDKGRAWRLFRISPSLIIGDFPGSTPEVHKVGVAFGVM